MFLFFAMFGIVRLLLWALVLFQFITHVFTGRANEHCLMWGKILSTWIYRMMLFMSYNSDYMPFPFTAFGPEQNPD